ncbi:hypothetical protein K6Y31_20895 [Motilimonas cestriensis]|uniref:Uncharacterized protein n=1 Tax=Motilimonas cestriensis TaxID=2742685 RepID=A0ABS8WFH0_9GAMM|nr:hypothetical protein [Motilimonas cestriensis]MCE2597235.1 hypothetical protein [Motilimonas cestriensis]
MIVKGMILSKSDVQPVSKVNPKSGEAKKVGTLKLLVTEPTQVIDVGINENIIAADGINQLRALSGDYHEFTIEFKEMSFGNDAGKHVQINGFHLVNLPAKTAQK